MLSAMSTLLWRVLIFFLYIFCLCRRCLDFDIFCNVWHRSLDETWCLLLQGLKNVFILGIQSTWIARCPNNSRKKQYKRWCSSWSRTAWSIIPLNNILRISSSWSGIREFLLREVALQEFLLREVVLHAMVLRKLVILEAVLRKILRRKLVVLKQCPVK